MGFEKVYITKAGLELEAKSRTGKAIKILRVDIGDGELTDNNITEKKLLVNKKLECKINSLQEIDSQTIINFILQQSEVDEGFYFREFGVIAEEPDTQEEVLYLYANAGNKAEFIDDKTSTAVSDRIIDIVLKADNTDNISISIDNTGVYIERKEFQQRENNLLKLINTKSNKKKVYNIEIEANWTEGTKTIEIEGIQATDEVNIYPIWSETKETRQQEKEEYNKISMIKSGENTIEIICDEEVPEIALNARIEVVY